MSHFLSTFKRTAASLVLLTQLTVHAASTRAAVPCGLGEVWYQTAQQDTTRLAGSGGKHHYVHQNGSNSTDITHSGKISISEDEKDIRSISPGGYLKYSKSSFGNRRTLKIESDSQGRLSRTYKVGGKEVPYEPEGRQFLADIMPDLVRNSGIGAEDRVARLYAASGARGVLNEVNQMESDYVKGIYLGYLLRQPKLKDSEMQDALSLIKTSVSSDYEKGKLLSTASKQLGNEKTAAEYLNVTANMSSDYEKGKALQEMLEKAQLNPALFGKVMATTAHMSSDYEKSKLMQSAIMKGRLTAENQKQILESVSSFSSDYERSRVLQQLLGKEKLPAENLTRVLGATLGMSSDYERGRVLQQVVSSQNLSSAQLAQVCEAAGKMSSDYEKSRLLQQVAPKLPANNSQALDAYKKSAKTISSEYEYGRVMRALE